MNNDRSLQHPRPNNLQLGHELWSLRPTLHNGPGWRVPLWVQGCSIRCTTVCLNPHFLDRGGGFSYGIDEIVSAIARLADRSDIDVEGITMLGGEPTDQAAAVGDLFGAVRALGLSTMLYSGATLEQLKQCGNAEIAALLAATDLLVDGPFLPREFDRTLIWRGSRNQRVLCLSQRYDAAAVARALAAQGRSYSVLLTADGRLSASGLQTRKGARAIQVRLQGTLQQPLD